MMVISEVPTMNRFGMVALFVASMLSWGCVESNPQPAPEHGADTTSPPGKEVIGRQDGGIAVADVAVDLTEQDVDVQVPEVDPEVVSPPEGCCFSDEHCDPGDICVGVSGNVAGTCAPPPGTSSCYPGLCPPLHICVQGQVCGCGQEGCQNYAGSGCLPVEGECCESDENCPEGAVCESLNTYSTCVAAPGPGECWNESDCQEDEVCVGAFICGCMADCEWKKGFGNCVPAGAQSVAQCVLEHTDCGCAFEGCVDGFSDVVFYPEDAGEFPNEVNPPAELLEVAVARYGCSYCACHESHKIKVEGEWTSVDVVEFCTYLVNYDEQCGDCLAQWEGGCC